jgi:hypothetical protein
VFVALANRLKGDDFAGMSLEERVRFMRVKYVEFATTFERARDAPAQGQVHDGTPKTSSRSDAPDLDSLVAEIDAVLREAPALTSYLDRMLAEQKREASSLARALLALPARALILHLADHAVSQATDRHVAQRLAWRLLPVAADWKKSVATARAAFTTGERAVELSLRSKSVAEIVLAGADGLPAQFVPGTVPPDGVPHIPLPSVAHVPLFGGQGEQLVRGVLKNLREESLPDQEIWRGLYREYPTEDEFAFKVDEELATQARTRGRYMLIIDAQLDPCSKKDMNAAWQTVKDAFGEALQHLRLVRLTGRSAQMKEEHGIEPNVRRALGGT